MKITIAYYTKINGNFTKFSDRVSEIITGENARDCMSQIAQKKANHDLWKFTPIEIKYVED